MAPMPMPMLLLHLLLGLGAVAAQPLRTIVVAAPEAAPLERLAAQELRRYWHARSGALPTISDDTALLGDARGGEVLVLGSQDGVREVLAAQLGSSAADALDAAAAGGAGGPDAHTVATVHRSGARHVVALAGATPKAVLYAAYTFVEHALGVRFLLHGDVVPPQQDAFVLPELSLSLAPVFELRGLQPFHDFTAGPDWWSADDYKVVMTQMTKLKMNFIGFHS